MQFFIEVGVVLFASLFFLMSLPISNDWIRMELEINPQDTPLD